MYVTTVTLDGFSSGLHVLSFNVYSPETAMGKAPNAQGDSESSYAEAVVKYVLGYIPVNMTKFQFVKE